MNNTNAKKDFSLIGSSYLIGAVVYYVLVSVVFSLVYKFTPQFVEGNGSTILSFAILFLVGYPVMYLLVKRVPKTEIPKKKLGIGMMIVTVLVSYFIMITCNILGLIINAQIGKATGKGLMNPIVDVIGSMNPIVQVLVVMIAAPIVEELVFRKLIVDRVYKYGEVLAAITSGLMFGLFHGNFQQFIYAFGGGVFFAFIYIRTGKIIYTMICHVVINTIGSIPTFLMGDLDVAQIQNYIFKGQMDAYMEYVNAHVMQFAAIGLFGLIMLFVILAGFVLAIVFHKKFKFETHEGDLEFGQACKSLFCNTGMILFALWWVANIVIAQFGTSFRTIIMNILS